MNKELEEKLGRVRLMMAANGLGAVHFGGLGNLAWLLGGADLAVSLTNAPVAEAVVTKDAVTVVASSIEQERLEREELLESAAVVYAPWYEPEAKDKLIGDLVGSGRVLSDTPGRGWPTKDFWPLRVPLLPDEVARYRGLCRETSAVFSEVLMDLPPGLSEHEISGRLAEGLRAYGMQPVVLLVGSDERLENYKHPVPQAKRVENRVMAVACPRRHGLYANITRFVSFGETEAQKRDYAALLNIEAALLDATQHGVLVKDFFKILEEAYAEAGFEGAWREHHQGGPTGYLTRDFLAVPGGERMLVEGSAYAWNPSLPGVKVEDTALLMGDALELLTLDDRWPTREVGGRRRPEVLVL